MCVCLLQRFTRAGRRARLIKFMRHLKLHWDIHQIWKNISGSLASQLTEENSVWWFLTQSSDLRPVDLLKKILQMDIRLLLYEGDVNFPIYKYFNHNNSVKKQFVVCFPTKCVNGLISDFKIYWVGNFVISAQLNAAGRAVLNWFDCFVTPTLLHPSCGGWMDGWLDR